MTTIAKEVGYRIRKIREAKDFNQQDIANKLKITNGAYAKIERGETDSSITRLFEIAGILKTDIMSLLKDTPESEEIYTQLKTLTKDMEMTKKELATLKKPSGKKKITMRFF